MDKIFYEFNQNNSGGRFVVDDKVCNKVIIEVDTEQEAINKGLTLGIYFDGCHKGIDCPCCGDRWHTPSRIQFPLVYGKDKVFEDIETYTQCQANEYGWTKPDARIYYKDGTITEIFKK